MKTLICIPCLLTGGTEIQTLNTVHALVQGGHQVTVACYFEHTPYMVERYRKAGVEVLLFSPEGTRVGGYRAIPYLYKHLRRTIKAVRPDVTHVQYMAPGAMVILLLWLMGVKNIIATAHTAADIYKDLRLLHFIQRHCLRAFTCITERAECSFFGSSQLYTTETVLGRRNHFTIYNCLQPHPNPLQGERGLGHPGGSLNSKHYTLNENNLTQNTQNTQNIISSHGCQCDDLNSQNTHCSARVGLPDGDSTPLTLNRCDAAFNQQSSIAINRSEAASVLGIVSRLESIKGMDLVVPAFAEVLKRHSEVRLLVVGDGSLRATMEQQAAELGCADCITWVGRQPQEELDRWYGQMDIVLMPSRSEGFGLTAIEAMANGCVVVASDVGGLPEVVRDGVCGLLHSTEDVQDMAEKIGALLGDATLYDRLRAQALCEVEKYSFAHYATLVNDLYDKLHKV